MTIGVNNTNIPIQRNEIWIYEGGDWSISKRTLEFFIVKISIIVQMPRQTFFIWLFFAINKYNDIAIAIRYESELVGKVISRAIGVDNQP
jgi:hypothetical protein